MTKPKLVKLPKAADVRLITALAELGSAIDHADVTGYICLVTYKTGDADIDDTRYYSSSDNKFKDLYLTRLMEKYIMGDLPL